MRFGVRCNDAVPRASPRLTTSAERGLRDVSLWGHVVKLQISDHFDHLDMLKSLLKPAVLEIPLLTSCIISIANMPSICLAPKALDTEY